MIARLIVPLFIEVHEFRRQLRPTAPAPVLPLAGGLALRWILVAADRA